jgi:iron complex outermembrane receptor protein
MKNRLYFLLIILLLGSQFAVAQTARIEGLVADLEESLALEYASVSLFALEDSSLIGGTLTDAEGRFEMLKLPVGNYYLVIQFMGYQADTLSSIELMAGQNLSLGKISLTPTQLLLNEVEISGRKITSFHAADRQIFTAEQFQNAQGGSATDVLRNLPALSVNALGEISVRGTTGFVVMLNGRPVQTDPSVILNQLPANAIEKIEVITSPSARFDPDGKAGIINITTRQSLIDGFYLRGNLQYGLPSIEPYDNKEASRRYGADLTLTYKKNKWDLAAGLDYRRNDIGGQRIGYVNTWQNEILTEFPSDGERSFDRENYSGRFSVRYAPDSKKSLGASFYAGKRTQFRTADILYDFQQRSRVAENQFLGPEAYWDLYQRNGTVYADGIRQDSLTYFNENLRVRRGDFLIGALNYDHEFGDQSQLQLSALYEHTILGGPTDNNSLAWPETQDTLQLQFNDNLNPLDGLRLQADYTRKLGQTNWSSGYLYRFLNHPGDFTYLDRNLETNTWSVNPNFTNRIELRRQIHALYSQFAGQKDRWHYNAGLRLEYMDRRVRTAEPDTTYRLDLLTLFPSLTFSYDLGQGWLAKTGYSRRIQRTTTFKMTPFPEREHSETLEQGDAELLPEFVNQVELGLVKSWQDNSVYVTSYYRQVRDVINRVNSIYNDSILNRIYTNAGMARAVGIEGGFTVYPVERWSLYMGGNVYNYQIKGNLFGEEINTSNLIYSINAHTSVQLAPTLDLQLAFNYLSRRVTAQGEDSRFYNPSLTLRKTFWNKRMTATLQWQSIDLGLLAANEQRITTVRDHFFTTTNYVYEVDRILLGLSFQLNQPSKDVKLIKSEFGDKEW